MHMKTLHQLSVICATMAIICAVTLGFFPSNPVTQVIGMLLGVEFILAAAGWLYTQGYLDAEATHRNRPKDRPLNRITRDL